MNATDIARVWILNDYRLYKDCRDIAMKATNEFEAAHLIKDYLTECIDRHRPSRGHAWGLVCDILALFPHEIDHQELVRLARDMRNNEA